jgi:N-acetylglucosamine kinase-like BadF-type ATPase
MLFLGVDGGASKTAALLVDSDGQVLGWGLAGGSNYHTYGMDAAYSSVKTAVDTALQGRRPDAASFCMAAADMPHDFTQLRTKFAELELDCAFSVRNDSIGIFRAGSRFFYGVGVVCGTGFNAGGISKNGEEFRFPSLGQVTGDFAGAGDLAYQAVGAAFRAWDGRGEPTLLADAMLRALDAPDFETVAERWVQRTLTPQKIKTLAPIVFEVSEAGDTVARQLIHAQGVELGTAANAILRRLDLIGEDCDVVLGGSMSYGKGDLLMSTVIETVRSASPAAVVKRLDVPPVAGAVLLAADSVGAAIDVGALRTTLPEQMRVPVTL